MTDRVHSLTVVLGQDMRTDDVQSLIEAISHFRNVVDVRPLVADPVSHMAQTRARADMAEKLIAVVRETRK